MFVRFQQLSAISTATELMLIGAAPHGEIPQCSHVRGT